MGFVSMDSNYANLLGKYSSKLYDNDRQTWTQAVIVE